MVRAKGLDDLFLGGDRPRFRRFYAVPRRAGEYRAPYGILEHGPVGGGGSLAAARAATSEAIEGFVGDLNANASSAMLVTSAPGAGKSTAVAASVKRHRLEARIVVGTKSLASEQAERYGYNLIVGRNRTNCQRYDVVRALGEAGHPVEVLACGTPIESRCPFRARCPYFAQYERSGPRVGTAEQLFNRLFLMGGTIAVVDDADLVRSLVERSTIRGDALERADKQLEGGKFEAERTVLRVVHHALIDADKQWLSAGLAWDHLAAAAARYDLDFPGLVEALPIREALPEPFDDYDGYVSVATVEAVPPASVASLLAALREELERFRAGEDFNSRIRFSASCVEVGRMREHISHREGAIIARMPLLVLDATPMTVLVDHLAALHERLPDVAADIALPPNVRVVQYATGSRGHTSMRSAIQHQRVLHEIQRERLRQPCDPGDEALVVFKEAATRFDDAGFLQGRVLTFGSARGTNALASTRRLHVVGRPFPPTDETHYVAQLIHHDEVAVSPELVVRQATFGGQKLAVDVVDYADPRMAALLHAARDAELLQVVHRARLHTLESQAHLADDVRDSVTLVVHTSHPVAGLRVDELIIGDESAHDRNGERQRDAERRIEQAVADLRSLGLPLTTHAVMVEAGANWRTVRKCLGNTLHTPAATSQGTGDERPLGNEMHTSVEVAQNTAAGHAPDKGLGNEMHTPYKDLLSRVQNVPQTETGCIAAVNGNTRSHWEPCRGGCGILLPPGQSCFDCAAAAVAAWKSTNEKRRLAS